MRSVAVLVYLGTTALALGALIRVVPLRDLPAPTPPLPARPIVATPAVPPHHAPRVGRLPRNLMVRPSVVAPSSPAPPAEPWTGAIFWDPAQPLAQVNGRLVGQGARVGSWSVAHIGPAAVLLVARDRVRLLRPWSGRPTSDRPASMPPIDGATRLDGGSGGADSRDSPHRGQ